jgi:hypothetical protein
MTSRKHKLGALVGLAAAAALTFGAVGVHMASASAPKASSDTDDSYNPANTTVSGHATNTVFTAGPITVTCTNSVAGGKTPKATAHLKAFNLKPLPVFNDGTGQPCTDNLGFTDTTNTNNTNGKWKIQFIDAPNDENGTEPNSGDKLSVTVPKAGAIVTNSAGCTITVAPTAAFKVVGAYDDVNKFTVAITNLPIHVTGPGGVCPLSTNVAHFNATYTFTPGVSDSS